MRATTGVSIGLAMVTTALLPACSAITGNRASVQHVPPLTTANHAGYPCLVFANDRTALYLDAATFKLVDIKDSSQDISYVVEPGGELFTLAFLASGMTHTANGAGALRHTYDLVHGDAASSTLNLRFLGCPIGSTGRTCDATVSITLHDGDPILDFGLEVTKDASTTLRDVHFPILSGLGSSLAGSADTDYIVVPGYPTFASPRSTLRSVVPNLGIDASSAEIPGGVCEQMLSYSDGQGNGGLYLAVEDAFSRRKYLQAKPMPGQQSFVAEVVHYPDGTATAAGWTLPYGIALGPVQGDWYDAAKIYRRRLLAQGRVKPIIQRTDLPGWFLDTNVWYQGQDPLSGSDQMAAFVAHLERIRSALGQPYAFHLYLWWKGSAMATGFPDYFPAVPGFAKALTALREKGVELMPYIDLEMFDTSLPRWTTDNAQLWASRDATGGLNPVYAETRPNVNMCAGTQYWQDLMLSCIKTLVQTYGARSVYLDELHYHAPLCYATQHGHADIGGSYLADGYRTIIRRAQAECGLKDLVLTGEHSSETYADLLAGQLVWAGVFPTALPAHEAILKDCTVNFGMQMMKSDLANLDSFAAKIGLQFTQGRQLGWINLDQGDLLGEAFAPQMAFLKSAAQCRGAAQDFLLYGEFLRPPDVSSAGTQTVGWSLAPIGGESQQTIPTVWAAAYRAPNHDLGMVLVNVTSTPRALAIPVNSRDWFVRSGGVYYRSDWRDGAWRQPVRERLGATLSVEVPAYAPTVVRLHEGEIR
jgi:hypothetical protein